MNQFSSIYGQLFCCNCPAGLPTQECNTTSGVIMSYPFLAQNNYVWVAGVVGFLIFIVLLTIAVIYCIRKRKRIHDNEMISIIRIRRALLSGNKDEAGSNKCLISNMYENPSFADQTLSGETRICLSASEESLDLTSNENREHMDLCDDTELELERGILNIKALQETENQAADDSS